MGNGILHKDEEGGLGTQLLIQREEEERGRDASRKLQGGRQGCFRVRIGIILVWLSLTAL